MRTEKPRSGAELASGRGRSEPRRVVRRSGRRARVLCSHALPRPQYHQPHRTRAYAPGLLGALGLSDTSRINRTLASPARPAAGCARSLVGAGAGVVQSITGRRSVSDSAAVRWGPQADIQDRPLCSDGISQTLVCSLGSCNTSFPSCERSSHFRGCVSKSLLISSFSSRRSEGRHRVASDRIPEWNGRDSSPRRGFRELPLPPRMTLASLETGHGSEAGVRAGDRRPVAG